MAGITWIYPLMKNIWPAQDSGPMKKIWDSASLTICCQLTTSPLALYYFGTFPTHFLLTNLLALPLTGFLVPIAILTVTLSAADLCPAILTEVCEKAASCLISVLETISRM
jgi:competence protein ComEC